MADLSRFSDLLTLSQALSVRKIGAVELAQEYLEAIAKDETGAFLAVDESATLNEAKAAQARIDRGEKPAPAEGALIGLPIAHKDIFVTRNWPTTAASKILSGYLSPFDATVVEKLSQAGAVCLGKTSCDEFAMGSGNVHSAYGPVKNPWDLSAVPGGSSGGSAAAVAAGLAAAATGTDTGGSIRQPAGMCGLTGIKPTYGRVSRWGMIAYASSLDQAGPMARTALDCAALLSVMTGFDSKDSTSLEMAGENFFQKAQEPWGAATDAKPLSGLRIGVPKEFFANGLSDEVRKPIESAFDELKKLGAQTVQISLPRTSLSIPAYYVIAPAEASSNLSRYDGVRYGLRASGVKDLEDLYSKSRAQGFGREVRRRILIGTFVLSHGYYDAYYLQAQKVRRLVAQDFDAAFSQCDVIAGPVAPSVAWDIEEVKTDPLQDYLADIYTLGVNLAGLPALSMPCGFGQDSHSRRPVGLQLIGPRFEEARILKVAHQYQRATDWHLRTPSDDKGNNSGGGA